MTPDLSFGEGTGRGKKGEDDTWDGKERKKRWPGHSPRITVNIGQ